MDQTIRPCRFLRTIDSLAEDAQGFKDGIETLIKYLRENNLKEPPPYQNK